MIEPVPHVAKMDPYALVRVDADTNIISLSQNESLRPPSPEAVKAATAALSASNLYPDPDWTDLRAELSRQYQIDAGEILCGNGSLDLIGCIARAFAGPGRAILAPAHAYPFFRTAAQMADAPFLLAPEDGTTVSVESLIASATVDTRIVFVANPGNPTGTRISRQELDRLRAGLRPDILLVIDEAYGEFTDTLDAPCFDMVDHENTVVLRTFSKAYGLAGFRVGWGVFPAAIAAEVRKVMNPNNISAAAQSAALWAVRDQNYMRETCDLTVGARDRLILDLRECGFEIAQSFANFALIEFDSTSAADSADQTLRRKGVILRAQGGAGLPHALRMTVGTSDQNAAAVSHLSNWRTEYCR